VMCHRVFPLFLVGLGSRSTCSASTASVMTCVEEVADAEENHGVPDAQVALGPALEQT